VHFEKPREIACRVLLQREAGQDYIENLLEAGLTRSSLSPADRGLLQELVYGTVRRQATLDWLISRKTGGRPQKPDLQVLLRLALYQIFWLSRIPDHAAVNETVELAKRRGFNSQSGFVNAVLRGYLRERERTERQLEELKVTDPAIGYSHPKWLVERWEKRLGRERLVSFLQWNNAPPATFARLNMLRASADHLREQWAREKVEAKLVPADWAGGALLFELQSFPSLATLKSFNDGWFYVQDPSTLLAVSELDSQPGETVLDFCSAPGGKTMAIAERMKNQGTLVAHDMTVDRLRLVEENCARMGVTCAKAVLPSMLDSGLTFDRILIDAPCSNTGVMRRRVDLRWRIRETELTRLRTTQLQLLRDAIPRLKPGGALVYSHPAMHLQRERALTPWENNVDGAYVARFVRGT
jgi:16S rRNA (cytosine967-C5)-methyltransferase